MKEINFKAWVYSEHEEINRDELFMAIAEAVNKLYPTASSIFSMDTEPPEPLNKEPKVQVSDTTMLNQGTNSR